MLGYKWNEADKLRRRVRARAARRGARAPLRGAAPPGHLPARLPDPHSPRTTSCPPPPTSTRSSPATSPRWRCPAPPTPSSSPSSAPSASCPASRSSVVEKHPFDGPLVVTVDGEDRTLGERVARQIYVTRREHHNGDARVSNQWAQRRPHTTEEASMTSILAAEGGYQEFVLKGGEWAILGLSGLSALIALAVGFSLMKGVLAADQGTPKMIEIATAIQEGSWAYLKRQFRTIGFVLIPLAVDRVRHLDGDREARRRGGPLLRRVRPLPHARLRRRRLPVGPHRLHRHDAGHPRQRAHGRCGQAQLAARRPQGGLPHRRHRRHVHGRPGPARRHRDHRDLPEHELGDPRRLRLRWLAPRPVPPGRRRHLHQGRRRRRRPRRQGRGGHPRGRPPQPGHHRRQRGRQRGRLRRHGLGPVRELRGHPRRLDHPRRVRLHRHRRQPGPRPRVPAGRPRRRRGGLDLRRLRREGQAGRDRRPQADQPRLPHRRRSSR